MRERQDDKQATSPSIYAAQLVQLVTTRWPVERAELLEGTGISDAVLADHEARIGGAAMSRLILRALELTREPGLGFYYGLHVKLSSHGTVGLAAMTSATLRDALEVGARYFHLRSGHTAMSYTVENGSIVVELEELVPLGPVRIFTIESMMTEFAQMARTLLGHPVQGYVELRHQEPEHFQGFAHLWPGPVRFGRPADRMIFSASLLDSPLVMADALASRQALERCEQEFEMLGETSTLLASVRRQMRARSQGFPTLTELADERHVSTRTLKRQLAAHGTSFQQLLDELRRDRALSLLDAKDVPIDRIAERLGYSDASNFNRAFRRWMGMSPSTFRQRSFEGDD